MRFMNTYEIEDAMIRYADHPTLGPATRTLCNVAIMANTTSDGWAYWPKPARAANALMELIQAYKRTPVDNDRSDVTPAKLRKAYTPLKAFRTRMGITHWFEIEEPS